MPGQPRKRANRALKAVPDRPPVEALREEPSRLGKNAQHRLDQQQRPLGPDMPPGKPLPHLPDGMYVPPKPTAEPQMEYPGVGHARRGNPEWQLWTEFGPDGETALNREWRVRWVPPEDRRCQARSIGRTNNWQGNRCTQRALNGARVCRFHGGTIPNVKKAAQAALATAALPAAEKLIHIALKKRDVSDADRLKAIIQILDRAGVEGKQTVTVELALWQQTLQQVYANNIAQEGEEVPGRELVEGVDYVLDDEEYSNDDGE